MKREQYDFDFFQSLPIDEVAENLGMVQERGGNYKSPLHQDKNPSLTLQLNQNSKYYNCWKDWSLNEGGKAIELVMAYQYGIKPSVYWANRQEYKKQLKDSLHFLNSHFPGGIKVIDDNSSFKKPPQIPTIPNEIIQLIGLKRNPLFDAKIGSIRQIINKYDLSQEEADLFKNSFSNDDYTLPLSDRTLILIDKFKEYERSVVSYAGNIIANFPDLDGNALDVILAKTESWTKIIQPYIEKLKDFYIEMSEIEYPDIDFERSETELFQSDEIAQDYEEEKE